ncbi:MAG: carboxypeptidase-like regulatory domain-containing protein, partial [Candidatus Acidiferrales bacterium]
MKVFLFAILWALMLPAVFAQEISPSSVCGVVQDQTGAVIAGVALQLTAVSTRLEARTGAGGEFCFRRVAPGSYELALQLPGFRGERRNLIVRPGQTINLNFSLALESIGQQVTVAEGSADAASLNVAQTEIGAGLIQNLPSESVNAALSSILTLATPGVAADSNGVFHP